MSAPLVAIVGVPNVGKSTLFNRLVGSRRAIVTDEPGATRDRIYGLVRAATVPFRIVDTGGLVPGGGGVPLAREMEMQVERAMREAAVVLLVVDARSGLTAADRDVAILLRRRGLPVIVVANKVDVPGLEALALEALELGFGDPVPVSAEHGLGVQDLLDRVEEALASGASGRPAEVEEERARAVRIAIVGRPNVGKSSLLNALLGDERALVSEIPGTTRDVVDTLLERDGRRYLLLDTAGLRRPGRRRAAADALSEGRAREAIDRSDVVAVVLDASEGFVAQDAHIAGLAREASKPLVVAVNKWDLAEGREDAAKAWERELRDRLRFAPGAPVLFVSAKTGQRAGRVLEAAEELHRLGGIRVPTPELNRWLGEVARTERAAPARGRSIRLFYATQLGVHPPRFVLFCNDATRVHFSLRRHLESSLKERFGYGSVPVRLRFRSRREKSP